VLKPAVYPGGDSGAGMLNMPEENKVENLSTAMTGANPLRRNRTCSGLGHWTTRWFQVAATFPLEFMKMGVKYKNFPFDVDGVPQKLRE